MAGGIPDELIEKIRQGNDIVGLISEYISLRQNGSRYVGLCPFHNEKTPSFSVSKDKQLYYCFGCHASGNVFSFVMNIDGLNFVEAARKLGSRVGIDISEHVESEAERSRRRFRERIMEACETAGKYYSWMLTDSKNGARCREYVGARGIDDAALKAFNLGYAPDSASMDGLTTYLMKKGFEDEVLLESGLSLKKKYGKGLYDAFRDRLIFPIADQYGRVVAFGGRVIAAGDNRPKYVNSKEGPAYSKRANLYNLHAASTHARAAGRMVLCEGYLDAMAYWKAGVKEAVASLGTALTKEQAKLIARFCGQVLISYDADKAGSAATVKGVALLEEAGLEVKVVSLPEGEDPDSLLRKTGPGSLVAAVDGAKSFLRYQVEKAIDGANLKNADSKLAAVKKLVRIIGGCADAVTRNELVREVSGRLAVSPDALMQDVSRTSSRLNRSRGGPAADGSVDTEARSPLMEENGLSYAIAETERAILRLCADEPGSIKLVSENLTEGFEAEGSEELYRAMYSLWEDGKVIDQRILPILEGRHKELAARLLMDKDRPFQSIDEAIKALKSMRIRRRLREIDVCIRKAEADGRIEDIVGLQVEQKRLREILGSRTALY
ncbi:MAG TPA: DNA primase [Bacillota bacterium]|nr:DNA primase [Bacillota bacterium]